MPKRPSLSTSPLAQPIERPTMRERNAAALAARTIAPQEATAATTRKKAPDAAQGGRGTRPSAPPVGTTPVHLYLPVDLYDAMRDAYVWQYGYTSENRQTSMGRWVGAALSRYARMSRSERAAAAAALTMPRGTQAMRTHSYHVPDADARTMAAVLDDGAQWTDPDTKECVTPSRSQYATAALWIAVETTRAQAGGELPRFAGRRLPYQPE